MELNTAIQLIEGGIEKIRAQQWIDLGSGDGLFSTALATMLDGESSVMAIDKSESSLKRVPTESYPVLTTAKLDFVHNIIPVKDLDGILMANSLHFVKDKVALFSRLRENLKPSGRIIIVEYDMAIPSPWVPYPVNFKKLESLASRLDWAPPQLLRETPSAYSGRNIYSALLSVV